MNDINIWQKHREIEVRHISAMHKELGLFYGYPECCINQFCKEVCFGILCAQYRESVHQKPIPVNLGYVPCDACMRKM